MFERKILDIFTIRGLHWVLLFVVVQIFVYDSQQISRVWYLFVAHLKKNHFCVLLSPVDLIWPFVFSSLSFSQNKTHSQSIVNICRHLKQSSLWEIVVISISCDLWQSVLTAQVMCNVLQETATGGAHSTATLRHECPPVREKAPTTRTAWIFIKTTAKIHILHTVKNYQNRFRCSKTDLQMVFLLTDSAFGGEIEHCVEVCSCFVHMLMFAM